MKSSKPCSWSTTGGSPCRHHQDPALISATKTQSLEPQSTANQKAKKTYGWMDTSSKPSQKTNPVEVQSRTSVKSKTAIQSQEAISSKTNAPHLTKADRKKAEARARNAAKKRDFQDAPDESSSKRASKKSKANSKPNATPPSDPFASRRDLVLEREARTATGLLSPALTHTPSQPIKKPRKKEPPKHLDLHNSNTASKHRNPTTSPSSAAVTPKSKLISSLSKLNAALASKLRSLGYSPTLLHPALFSPAEIARLAALASVESDSHGLRRSLRLTPEAHADVFLNTLGQQIAVSSPRGVKGSEESPNRDELDEFEKVMMESSSPELADDGRRPSQMTASGTGGGYFGSEESEEE